MPAPTISLRESPTLEQRLAVRTRPGARSVMYQSWRELLFLHWKIESVVIQALLPPGLTVDTYDGQAWVGLVPFFMRRIRPWWCPQVPGISNFQELNCRSYVVDRHGVPGVWFFSLDANARFAVWWGKTMFHLPYARARMRFRWDEAAGRVDFHSRRCGAADNLASRFTYEPVGRAAPTRPGSLEFFLVERYVLFTRRRDGRLVRGVVHHAPYQVSAAHVTAFDSALLRLNRIAGVDGPPDHALISRRTDVEVFPLQPVP